MKLRRQCILMPLHSAATPRTVLALSLLVFATTACGGAGTGAIDRPGRPNPAVAVPQGLPTLIGLDTLKPGPARSSSSTQFNLLAGQPVLSNTGTGPAPVPAPAEVTLDPAAAGGMAWAIYGLSGFPDDGSIVPLQLRTDSNAPLWVGLADFAENHWDFGFGKLNGTAIRPLSNGQRLISPGGRIYLAVVSAGDPVTVTDLTVFTSGDLVETPLREVLVVYNANIPEDVELAQYYAAYDTGRFVDEDYMLGLDLADAEDFSDAINRAEYENTIRDPIRAYLDNPLNSEIKQRTKYILLMKGIPHRIFGGEGAAVDSELCLLYADSGPANGGYSYEGRLWSGKQYPTSTQEFNGNGFYEPLDGVTKSFEPNVYKVVEEDGTLHDLNFLVGRISAYTYDEARLIIDRSKAADTSGIGWVILDSHPGWFDYDTMSDPVWPWPDADDQLCLIEILEYAGFKHHENLDFTVELFGDLPDTEIGNNVIAYCGWGVNHSRFGGDAYPSDNLYILQDLGFTYRPGAAWIVYESFAAAKFSWEGNPQLHDGQGQICDFIRMGGTVAIGYCFEPFTDGMADERRVLERYLLKGDRWIEAAYKGTRYFSWMTIVVGDPYCRVVAE